MRSPLPASSASPVDPRASNPSASSDPPQPLPHALDNDPALPPPPPTMTSILPAPPLPSRVSVPSDFSLHSSPPFPLLPQHPPPLPPLPAPTPSPPIASSSSPSASIHLLLNHLRLAFVSHDPFQPSTLDPQLIHHLFSSASSLDQSPSWPPPVFSQLSDDEIDSLRLLLCSIPSEQLSLLASSPAFARLCSNSNSHSDSDSAPTPTTPYFRDQTQSSSRILRKRSLDPQSRLLSRRQSFQGNGSGPAAEGYPACTAVSNAILSCFPTSKTTLVQHTWSKFIWNNNYPTFIGSRFVDIYLFNAQSETPVANWTSVANDRGMIGIYAADDWFPKISQWDDGRNLSYPYFFVITTAGAPLTGGEQHQSTFTVLQTAPQAEFVSASLSSASLASVSTSTFPPASATPNSSLQNEPSDNSFPQWEIALIVILGFFALVAFFVAAYLAFNNARRRRQIRLWQQAGVAGSGGSVGSRSPMIQNSEGAALMAGHKAVGISASARDMNSPTSSRPGSPLSGNMTAATNMFSFPGSTHVTDHPIIESSDGPITSVDATIMADAFRKALRKPEFSLGPGIDNNGTGPDDSQDIAPVEGEKKDDNVDPTEHAHRIRQSMQAQVVSISEEGLALDHEDEGEEAKEIMDRELASEGRSMTSVDNRKRPEVHGSQT